MYIHVYIYVYIYKWPYLNSNIPVIFPMLAMFPSPGGPGVGEAHPLHARNGRGDPDLRRDVPWGMMDPLVMSK